MWRQGNQLGSCYNNRKELRRAVVMKVEKRRRRGEFVQEHNQQVLETGCGMSGPLASGLGYWRSDLAVFEGNWMEEWDGE